MYAEKGRTGHGPNTLPGLLCALCTEYDVRHRARIA